MSELMYKDNIENITNIDISDVVIEQMKELYKENFEKMQCNYENKLIKNFKFPFKFYKWMLQIPHLRTILLM